MSDANVETVEGPPEKRKIKEYKPRTAAKGVEKPVIYPAALVIAGSPAIFDRIEELHPNDGNARREALMLASTWARTFNEEPVTKGVLIAQAAFEYQRTTHAFADQPRKNGDGFHRARCSMAKTCHAMLKSGLFVVSDA